MRTATASGKILTTGTSWNTKRPNMRKLSGRYPRGDPPDHIIAAPLTDKSVPRVAMIDGVFR